MRHEFGHGMGLLHVLNFKDLLYPIVGPDTCKVIHYDDQLGGNYELVNVAPYLDAGVCYTPNPRYQSLVCTGDNTNGIDEIGTNADHITVYPNPFNQSITVSIEISSQADVKIELVNILGQAVLTDDYTMISDAQFLCIINTAELSEGVYLLKISVDRSSSVFKLIKN